MVPGTLQTRTLNSKDVLGSLGQPCWSLTRWTHGTQHVVVLRAEGCCRNIVWTHPCPRGKRDAGRAWRNPCIGFLCSPPYVRAPTQHPFPAVMCSLSALGGPSETQHLAFTGERGGRQGAWSTEGIFRQVQPEIRR